ncbi:biotin--[acetyl-CoA-carboxylase] ligase [Desulfurivibrio dismutans]|uniref:biotin--[acetyl-CoA-carboxylase] ligase n=1 Tax=Desulfurivibrio dismutans TaxID=1398908 RepID=UPI0023DBAB47|nr:biotin--[acetyl-CoA-carboxylase] ligase [Desulfurivibrio alkaliphilus]MDF1614327.1 biotin--[acetyl-CoA-carboxylase] ligase [Desulfurivibrio alkaliphilus]
MNDVLEEPVWRELAVGRELSGRPLTFLAVTDSTNRVALEMAEQGGGSAVVVADRQTGGRGRLQRSWHSPPGVGIYASFLYRPRLAPHDLAKLTLAAGLAVALALEKSTGLQPGLKWPNDILLAGRKCGGILCECRLAAGPGKIGEDAAGSGQSDRDTGAPGRAASAQVGAVMEGATMETAAAGNPAVVIGLGLNVNTTSDQMAPELLARATSLRMTGGRSWDRGALLKAIGKELDEVVAALEQGRFPAILAAWRQRDALLGRELDWLTPAGEVVRGRALGPDHEGILQIRDRQGRIHAVMSGDLTLQAGN